MMDSPQCTSLRNLKNTIYIKNIFCQYIKIINRLPFVSQSFSSTRSSLSFTEGRAMFLTSCSISVKLFWNLTGFHFPKTQWAQSFLAILTSPAELAAAENTGTPPSKDNTADASQWSSKAANFAMYFSTYSLAKSTWDFTRQSNKE